MSACSFSASRRLTPSRLRRLSRRAAPVSAARRRDRPAPGTTPVPRVIICSSSSFSDDAAIAASTVICRRQASVASDWFIVCIPSFSCPACMRRIDLVHLVVANQVPDRRRRHHDLERHDPAAAVGPRQQRLADDAFEHQRQLGADLPLLVRREHVDDAVDRLRRRIGVQRRERQVARSRQCAAPTRSSPGRAARR